MTGPVATAIVNVGTLAKVVVASLVAGIGVTTFFAMAVYGATRYGDLRRGGRGNGALAYGAMALIALLVCGAAIAYGIVLTTQKG